MAEDCGVGSSVYFGCFSDNGLLPNEGFLMDFINLSLGSSRVVGDSRCARLGC